MPAPRMITRCPLPWFGARSGGPANASGTRISPIATIVSYSAAAPPAAPTVSRKRRRVQFESLIANPPINCCGERQKNNAKSVLGPRSSVLGPRSSVLGWAAGPPVDDWVGQYGGVLFGLLLFIALLSMIYIGQHSRCGAGFPARGPGPEHRLESLRHTTTPYNRA